MKIFLTGGAGFIGSNLVRYILTREDCFLINLDKLTYAGNRHSISDLLEHERHIFVEGDINDRDLVSSIFSKHNPTVVINLAAETHVDRSIDNPSSFIHTNINGTFRLLESARIYRDTLSRREQGNFRFIQVSTDEVYGPHEQTGELKEGSPYSPGSPYSASKASADHLVRAYQRTYGLPAMITISSNNYGPFQFPEKLIPLMIQKALSREKLPVYGDGAQVRDWLYVEDNCRALFSVISNGQPGETYHIGSGSGRTNLRVVQTICRIMDRLKPLPEGRIYMELISHVKDRPGHDRRYAIDSSKIRRHTGWQPRVSFNNGLEETVSWYLEHQDWVQNVTSGKYRMERLGLNPVKEEISG